MVESQPDGGGMAGSVMGTRQHKAAATTLRGASRGWRVDGREALYMQDKMVYIGEEMAQDIGRESEADRELVFDVVVIHRRPSHQAAVAPSASAAWLRPI